MKRPTYIIIFIGIVIVVLTVLQISIANQISTTGAGIAELQKKVADYERENIIMQEKILDASSYTNIEEKADELGYASVKSEIVIGSSLPLAMRQ